MTKTPTEVQADITRRLARTWATDLTGTTHSWPHAFPLGIPVAKAALEAGFAVVQRQSREWRDWARDHNVALTIAVRRVHGTDQDIPTHLVVDDIETAARLTGRAWIDRLARTKERLAILTAPQRFSALGDPAVLGRVLRATDEYTDTDFHLLVAVADWFNHNNATGYTPRQVPIEGIHAKWLNSHQPHILAMTGRDSLDLLARHPARINFTYLDPEHRAAGGRWHDTATVGDTYSPAYLPNVVVISENKDTAIHFPVTPGGIAVEGAGYGGGTAAAFPWLTNAPRLYYWGDIDAHGYEILNGFRQAGIPVTSMLMDTRAFETYQRYGTNLDKSNQPLGCPPRKQLPLLTDAERAVYERLTDPAWTGHRRIEQERIPLDIASKSLRDLG